ncbi:MAG: Asp-tRNA(Asn)/Glu-tRNA(Gln) amidotransferase subunit GatB [Planctomycetia bacterium]|nr:Asp-tRNA(Asn)/Glu-tRNA(Gln) amidotransferase subunit GatB [Planctomycetia bacterium]
MNDKPYEIIIGLEVHVQLQTRSKLFCRCSTTFGQAPNTQTCPVCIGMPGALPVMNRRAYELALRAAVALNLEIPAFTKWDRKNYFYPDLPKGYQISQFDLPMSQHGWLEISDPKGAFEPKRVRITRAHLEDDAGKSMHDEAAGKSDSRIDLNRTGTPLLEIVSEPDMRSPQEAKAYLTELRLLLTYLGVSDCNMQEGSLRVDGNINLHIATPAGKVATPIAEVKNMNSFRAVERAMAYEAERQYEVWCGNKIKLGDKPGGHKTTRGWDDGRQLTVSYFPDPDLLPVLVTPQEVDQVRANLGELPAAMRKRLETTYGLDPYDSDVLVNQGRGLVVYYEELAIASGDGRRASNWVQQDVLRTLNEQQQSISDFAVSEAALAGLLKAVQAGDLDNSRAKEVFDQMVRTGKSAAEIMFSLGIAKVDASAAESLCRELLEANPKVVEDLKAGKTKAVGSLIGQAKQRNPNVNPAEFKDMCLKIVESM